MLGRARQALVEMSTQAAAVAMVKFAGDNPLFICGKRVYLNFSKSQELQRKGKTALKKVVNVLPTLIKSPSCLFLLRRLSDFHASS